MRNSFFTEQQQERFMLTLTECGISLVLGFVTGMHATESFLVQANLLPNSTLLSSLILANTSVLLVGSFAIFPLFTENQWYTYFVGCMLGILAHLLIRWSYVNQVDTVSQGQMPLIPRF